MVSGWEGALAAAPCTGIGEKGAVFDLLGRRGLESRGATVASGVNAHHLLAVLDGFPEPDAPMS